MSIYSFFSEELNSHQKLHVFLISFFILSVTYGQQPAQKIKRLTTKDGLSNNSVYSLLQDKNDFIWVGTKDGLNKYDGYKFTVYRNLPNDTTSISHNEIWGLAEDSNGDIWIATYGGGVSKFDSNTETFQNYLIKPTDSTKVSHNYTNTIFVDSKDRVWSGNWNGMDLYNPKKKIFEPILSSPKHKDSLYFNSVYSISEDSNSNIWVGTDGAGLLCYAPKNKKVIKRYPSYPQTLKNRIESPVTSFLITKEDNIWIQNEFTGTSFLDTKTGIVKHYFEKDSNNQSFTDFSYRNFIFQDTTGRILASFFDQGVHSFDPKTINDTSQTNTLIEEMLPYNAKSLIKDKTGSLWIGTETKGLLHLSNNVKPFYYNRLFKDSIEESITKIFKDDNGLLWFGSHDFGLARMDPKTGEVVGSDILLASLDIDVSRLKVQDISKDPNGDIWISTLQHGFISINPSTLEAMGHYFIQRDTQATLTFDQKKDDIIVPLNSLLVTKDGFVWIASKSGAALLSYNPQNKKLKYFINRTAKDSQNYLPGLYITDLEEDDEGNLLVSFSDNGVHMLDKKTQRFLPITYNHDTPYNSAAQNAITIYLDTNKNIWIGTVNGLFKKNPKTKEVIQYTTSTGLSSNFISNIIEDTKENIWLTTNNGISKLNPVTEIFKNYTVNDGPIQTAYISGSVSIDNNGIIYFGGKEGVTFFDPKKIVDNKSVPTIVITSFMKKGKNGRFEKVPGINLKKDLQLPYDERDFFIEFAALDFTDPTANKHQYQLEGYHENWIELDSRRQVTFTNLDPGTYTLRLKGSNNDGSWNEIENPLIIQILSPWWSTWWAYCIYTILSLILIIGLHYYRIKNIETSKLKKLNESKTRLFTNISHELRTPLTLISGPVEQILSQKNDTLDTATQDRLKMVSDNTNSLKTLVDDILELSRLEEKTLIIDEQSIHLPAFLKQLTDKFETLAEKNAVHFNCSIDRLKNHNILIDRKKVEKIINNFLSNAIKHTPKKGAINFTAIETDDQLQIIVENTRQHIFKKDIPQNFDHYFTNNQVNKPLDGGYGIGLSLIKELVGLMQGKITVDSNLVKGSTFAVAIPIKETTKKEIAYSTEIDDDHLLEVISLDHLVQHTDEQTKEYTLMIVEDNISMQKFITSVLDKKYYIVIANDGEEALQQLKTNTVDLIISDVMMPIMDGYELLETIKKSEEHHDIPFIMLTALSEIDHKLKALTIGVDDYLSKPFVAKELLARTHNLISRYQKRKELKKEIYRVHTISNNAAEATIENTSEKEIEIRNPELQSKKDIELIEQAAQIIKTNIENQDFKLMDLCQLLNVSERQLRRRITLTTGLTPKKFQQEIMLQKAKSLLENNEYENITAVSLSIGMTHVTRFSNLYEARFGKHPSTYF